MNKKIKSKEKEFELYYDYLVSENEKYNLTAITDKNEVFIKHFEDSLAIDKLFDLDKEYSLCDIGSGAGFPSIPLKICYPKLKVTIIEPTLKRVNFMKSLVNKLGLSDVTIINGRAEDLAKQYSNQFDFVVARAVASLPILLELLVSYAKVNSYIVAYKGDKGEIDALNSKNALKVLSCEVEDIFSYELENELGKRTLIKILKKKETSEKYPRKYAEIKKKPL